MYKRMLLFIYTDCIESCKRKIYKRKKLLHKIVDPKLTCIITHTT